MERKGFISFIVVAIALISGTAYAQQGPTVVEYESITIEEVNCKTAYVANWQKNWFIQLGSGFSMPVEENYLPNGKAKRQLTWAINAGFGHWFSPFLGFRFSANGGALHWDDESFSKAKYGNLNLDLMWDMFNSIGNVNCKRVFSIIPFIGLGGTYVWDIDSEGSNIMGKHGIKDNSWTLPVSAGLQLRFRLCDYADFFVEGRAQFYGDNFNGKAYGMPIDGNGIVIGGFNFNLSRRGFARYNPCDNLEQIRQLNNQVNNLRAKLADCESRPVQAAPAPAPQPQQIIQSPSMLATVNFDINSAVISDMEMINVYNVANWMKENPSYKVSINGYADKDTGTPEYNMELSKKRAEAVYNILVNNFSIDPSRLTVNSYGSSEQPYELNDWNRIVIFRDK